jgi:hypothetical protein
MAGMFDGMFRGCFADRELARAAYDAHMAEVQRVVPPARLLLFNVKEGWAPLCAFLGVPLPPEGTVSDTRRSGLRHGLGEPQRSWALAAPASVCDR